MKAHLSGRRPAYWRPWLTFLAFVGCAVTTALGATAPARPAVPVVEVATELVPLAGLGLGNLPEDALRSTAPPLGKAPPGPPRKRSIAEQLGSRITRIRVTWYDTNRVESAAEAERLVWAWWQETTWPISTRFGPSQGFLGNLIQAEMRESDGSVGWLMINHHFPLVRAAWRDGAAQWRFTNHSNNRGLLLASERRERILSKLASANDDALAALLSRLAVVGEGDEQVGLGVVPYLRHTKANVRGGALSALVAARQPTNLVFEALNEALRDPDRGIRSGALWCIHRDNDLPPVDRRFLPAVLPMLGDMDESVRAAACTAAGWLGRQGNAEVAHRVVEELTPRLYDPKAAARASAASAMATLWENGREAIPVLAAVGPDPEENVRNAVTSALRSLREVREKPIEGVDVVFGVAIPKPSTNTGAGNVC